VLGKNLGNESSGATPRSAAAAAIRVATSSPTSTASFVVITASARSALGRNRYRREMRGPGYDGYLSGGPREGSESVVVVKHDHSVNVLVYNAPPGTGERLGALAARSLR
jgi:hypothetical protein